MNRTGFRALFRVKNTSDSLLANQKLIFILLTLGGTILVATWGSFDSYFPGGQVSWLRWITVGIYILNLVVAVGRKSARAIKQHLVAGFYFGTVFSMLLVMFTGAGTSPYWFILFFVIIGWFVLVPYPPREMTIHSLVFVFIFLVGQYAQDKYPVAHQDMIRMIFLYSGALFVGLFAAYNRDRMDRENTRIRENLDEMNRDLQAANHDLLENERDLKNSEEKYRTLIEKAVDGIIITQKGLLKFVNSSFCKMIRYDQEELNEQPYLRFVHPGDHQMMIDYHNRRMKGEDFQVIYRSTIIRKDGSPLPVELNTRTSDYNGEPAAFIIVRDISERIRNEEDLRQATASLEELNRSLEHRIRESSEKLTEANTQLIRLQKENLQSQFEVLRQQVNPHFLFNSLNVLTSLIKLEPDLAEKYTEHLSKVYRYVLENKEHDLVRLEVELDFIDAYIFLLNIRFMGKIMITISVNEKSRNLLILPLALQLLIENAIKHNAMSKRNPLKINIYVDENRILHVENNLQERESYIASTGVGLKNIEHRYRLLEKPLPVFYKSESIFVAEIPLIASSN